MEGGEDEGVPDAPVADEARDGLLRERLDAEVLGAVGRRLTDLSAMSRLREPLAFCQQLNLAVQQFLRTWSGHSQKRNPAVMLDQAALPWFAELNRSLNDARDDNAAFTRRITASTLQLQRLANDILNRACAEHPSIDDRVLRELLARWPVPPSSEGQADMLLAA